MAEVNLGPWLAATAHVASELRMWCRCWAGLLPPGVSEVCEEKAKGWCGSKGNHIS